MANKLISLEMPEGLINKIKEIAKNNSLSFSSQIRLILMAYIKENKE